MSCTTQFINRIQSEQHTTYQQCAVAQVQWLKQLFLHTKLVTTKYLHIIECATLWSSFFTVQQPKSELYMYVGKYSFKPKWQESKPLLHPRILSPTGYYSGIWRFNIYKIQKTMLSRFWQVKLRQMLSSFANVELQKLQRYSIHIHRWDFEGILFPLRSVSGNKSNSERADTVIWAWNKMTEYFFSLSWQIKR